MENKRNLKVRISILYIIYFAALIGGIIYNTAPEFIRGAQMGFRVSENMIESIDDEVMRRAYIYINVPVTESHDIASIELHDRANSSATLTASRFNILVSQDVTDDVSFLDLIFSSIGGSAALYIGSMAVMAFYIVIIVFIFLILHSLRRSVKHDLPLDKRCVWYTRLIGAILIVINIINSWGEWVMANGAAKYLEGSEFTVNTSFTLNYYMLLLAVLVIFTAEIFAIGSQLGEEQKFTI